MVNGRASGYHVCPQSSHTERHCRWTVGLSHTLLLTVALFSTAPLSSHQSILNIYAHQHLSRTPFAFVMFFYTAKHEGTNRNIYFKIQFSVGIARLYPINCLQVMRHICTTEPHTHRLNEIKSSSGCNKLIISWFLMSPYHTLGPKYNNQEHLDS